MLGSTLARLRYRPVAGPLRLRPGRARHFARSTAHTLAILAGAGAVVAWASFTAGGWLIGATCLFGWTLLALAVIDVRYFILPDPLTLLLVLTGLATASAIGPETIAPHLVGSVAGFAAFAAVSVLYRLLRGRDGLGFGDAKLMAGIGAWLSWEGLPSVVLIAAIASLIVILLEGALGRPIDWDRRLPFGAYLALGAWLVWIYGPLAFSSG